MCVHVDSFLDKLFDRYPKINLYDSIYLHDLEDEMYWFKKKSLIKENHILLSWL